jgi:hypothetical protein
MALSGVVIGVTGNFDRQILSSAVRKAGGRVDALVHKNLDYVVSDAMAIQRNTQRIRKVGWTHPYCASEHLPSCRRHACTANTDCPRRTGRQNGHPNRFRKISLRQTEGWHGD